MMDIKDLKNQVDLFLRRHWGTTLEEFADSAGLTGKWIPVSERLPEKDGRYLVCMSWDYHNMDVLIWADGWNCIRRINGKVSRKSEIDGAEIIAWMPLPEPWEDGE